MAQTANALLVFEPDFLANSLPIKASTEIFLGAAVGLTGGYARQLVAADSFAGFAEMHVNNSVATDGADRIPVRASGRAVLTVAGVLVTTDIGTPVYASDSQTFTLTSVGNSPIGTVYRWISTGVALVAFDTTNP